MDSEKSGVPQKNRDFLQQKKSGGFFSDIVKPLRWSVTSKLNPIPKMGPDFFALTVYIYWPTTLLFHRCRAFSMPHRRHQYLIFFFPTSARKQNNPLPPCASASRLEEGGGAGANNGELGSVGWEPAPCQSTCFQKVEGVHMVDPPADEFDLAGTDVMPACFSANSIQSGKDQSAL